MGFKNGRSNQKSNGVTMNLSDKIKYLNLRDKPTEDKMYRAMNILGTIRKAEMRLDRYEKGHSRFEILQKSIVRLKLYYNNLIDQAKF